jgi:UDP-N-acetylmuramoylalanine--D-glutamate ligase
MEFGNRKIMKIALLGFDREGHSTLRFLRRNNHRDSEYYNADIWVLDKKENLKVPAGIHTQLGPDYLSNLSDFDIVFRTPGAPYNLPQIQKACRDGVAVTSSTKLFFKKCPAKIIGITGTKGKGTTCTLLYNILRADGREAFLVGNIGTAALDLLPKIEQSKKSGRNPIVIFELSSFQLQDLAQSPSIAVALETFPDHQDTHKSLKEYYSAKANIGRWQKPADKMFFFKGNKMSRWIGSKSTGKKIAVNENDFDLFAPGDLSVPGYHNFKNSVMAATIARTLNVPDATIKKMTLAFRGTEHRLQFVRSMPAAGNGGRISFYNDSASHNPTAAAAAVRSFPGQNVILIAGGKNRNIDFTPLKEALAETHAKTIILFGENREKIQETIRPIGISITLVRSLNEALNTAYQRAEGNTTILFSPGSASFDQYRDYEERGRYFVNLVKQLKPRYPSFIYKSYSYSLKKNVLEMEFHFVIEPGIVFTPKVRIFGVDAAATKKINRRALENLIFHLGLAEIPSYWKCTCSPEIVIECGTLSPAQTQWWKTLFINGLGEFFYTNKIDFTGKDFLTVISRSKNKAGKASAVLAGRRTRDILVPMGGGKDSIVTEEILANAGKEFRTLVLGDVAAAIATAKRGAPPINIERAIDPNLLALNKKGYLNGHTPFSSYLSFLTVLCAAVFGYRSIAISQERSANEANVRFKGRWINHQYSKSYAFEKDFGDYSKKYLASDIAYFSFLRPLYEIQIARLFSEMPGYFPTFRSCNVGMKKNVWCGKCSKCVAIYLLLSPFIAPPKLAAIFHKDLLNDGSLWPHVLALLGRSEAKPFECVSTEEETFVALGLVTQQYIAARKPLPIILRFFVKEMNPARADIERRAARLFRSWDSKNFLPAEMKAILRDALK